MFFLQEEQEEYWTLNDDNVYWCKQRQSPPSRFVCSAIANQVDYYLSDDYLVKDKYLLRQIRCKKDGYVSIKLITSFKKVKKLTRDWQVVRSAITRNSKCIVVSKEGLRIRRRTKLSESLRKPRLLTSVLVSACLNMLTTSYRKLQIFFVVRTVMQLVLCPVQWNFV